MPGVFIDLPGISTATSQIGCDKVSNSKKAVIFNPGYQSGG